MNDKAIVELTQTDFDVVVLQANLAISARRGLSSWLNLEKPFWIDPVTYAFAAQPTHLMSEQKVRRGEPETRVDFKRTFRDLATAYGEPFTRVISERRSLRPEDFDGLDDASVVRSVIEWQRGILEPTEEDKRYLGELATLEPLLLTVPFFPLRGDQAAPPWLDVNLRLAEAAAAEYPRDRLAFGLLIEDSLFDDPAGLEAVTNRYFGLPTAHLWLWISENDEVTMTTPRARRLRDLVADATERGFTVHQAFGGSFSALLGNTGVTSVGYGVGYWEHKGWEPLAGGGLPTLRFFYPPLGQRLRFLDADAVNDSVLETSADFHGRVCACETCVATLEGDLANFARYGRVEVRVRTDRRGHRIEYDVPLPDSLRRSKAHFIRARGRQIRASRGELFDPQAHVREMLAIFQAQPIVDTRYLETWAAALG